MQKLSLTCSCGQEIIVPETAIGKSGLCPGCGEEVAVRKSDARPWQPRRQNGRLRAVREQAAAQDRHRSWRDFAVAVDLYNQRRFAEALATLDSLLADYPGDPNILRARAQCVEALHETLALPAPDSAGAPGPLTAELVHSVLRDKMLYGASDAVQLQAADMAARILGLYSAPDPRKSAQEAPPAPTMPAGHPGPAAPTVWVPETFTRNR